MGTRALIHIKDEGQTILTIYRQYDGYPSGLGADIYRILHKGKAPVINGFGSDETIAYNGMGCLAAQLVKGLKDKIGNVYIYAPDTCDVGEEYTYILSEKEGKIRMQILDVGYPFNLENFAEVMKIEEGKDDE